MKKTEEYRRMYWKPMHPSHAFLQASKYLFFDNLICIFCVLLGGEYLLGLYVIIISIKNKIFFVFRFISINQSAFKVYYWIIGPFILMLVYGRESIWVFFFYSFHLLFFAEVSSAFLLCSAKMFLLIFLEIQSWT